MLNKHQLQTAWTLTPKSLPPFAQSLHKILALWSNLNFLIFNKLLPTRSTSSTSATVTTSASFELAYSLARVTSINITEWVSESVTDKHCRWSESESFFTTSFGVFIVILSSWQRPKSTWKICLRIKLCDFVNLRKIHGKISIKRNFATLTGHLWCDWLTTTFCPLAPQVVAVSEVTWALQARRGYRSL